MLFSDDPLELEIKLLQKLHENKNNFLQKTASLVVEMDNKIVIDNETFFTNPLEQKKYAKKSNFHKVEEMMENSVIVPVPIKAYAFYDASPTIKFKIIEEPKIIHSMEMAQARKFKKMNNMTSEQKCFNTCLLSWNRKQRQRDWKRRCRFLVVKAVQPSVNNNNNTILVRKDLLFAI